ncbi:type II toxin-antitoxin system Phd/YefM family antitoxin [Cellulomonas xiejunii]|uniref:Antitoxin n=1 Tax=Cellulomonas xiejunii TaxID=2968083 RepID=A0ABY5KPS8_9CELL|nr:type II toxin-antitoxin system prevent-host-death family antitoxin [Cellulomonas xiejunii]MCC2321218.1 type II toxin-antitoxin system prevent-host-death family antitoxin [Cellulomonas xiejunii]UUI71805.1 type II toxin-antitoxin system prevent-host-death family antitoxin [Cellulomonas xiejunii]
MTTVGVRELRQDASGVLRLVEAGERVVVTVHGRPVADLVPHSEARPTWRPVADLAALFRGVDDPDWEQDMALVDGAATDPFERGSDR